MSKAHQLSHVHAHARLQPETEFQAAIDGHQEGNGDWI